MVVTLLLDDPNEGPPTVQGADSWRQQFGLEHVYVVTDPNFSMVPGSSVGTPQESVVDPRTMQVTYIQEGYSGEFQKLEELAMANKAASQ